MKKNNLGNWGIAALVAINLLLWLFFTPQKSQVPAARFPQFELEVLGEMLSTSALVLFACGLVLANRPRFLEPYFGGLDKMYITHKNIAMLAVILIVGHELWVPKTGIPGPGLWAGQLAFAGILAVVLLTVGPRVPFLSRLTRFTYPGWLKIHRWVGLFFMLAMPHLIMVEALLLHSPVLTTYTSLIYTLGTGAYLYKEFVAARLRPYSLHRVDAVNKLNPNTSEVVLKPQNQKLAYRAGQFLFVYFDGDKVFAEPHPFTISSAPKQDNLRLSIKSSGDWTSYLQTHLKPGATAHVDGPYGMFNYKPGAAQQVWMAGGIGITPFLSWMRDFDGATEHKIDFFYTVNVPAEALFLDEIEKAATVNKNFKAHISYSSQDGRLSVPKIVETSGAVGGKEIYMCGPFGMVMAFRDAFVEQGAKAENIHYEEFNFR
jgi:predicted ferric reductase